MHYLHSVFSGTQAAGTLIKLKGRYDVHIINREQVIVPCSECSRRFCAIVKDVPRWLQVPRQVKGKSTGSLVGLIGELERCQYRTVRNSSGAARSTIKAGNDTFVGSRVSVLETYFQNSKALYLKLRRLTGGSLGQKRATISKEGVTSLRCRHAS